MTKKEKETLVELLKLWFKQANFNSKTVYYRDPVLKLMKWELEQAGRWKGAPRGNSQPPKNDFYHHLKGKG